MKLDNALARHRSVVSFNLRAQHAKEDLVDRPERQTALFASLVTLETACRKAVAARNAVYHFGSVDEGEFARRRRRSRMWVD